MIAPLADGVSVLVEGALLRIPPSLPWVLVVGTACAVEEPSGPDIEVHPGDLPIILGAPHGGDLTPEEIPDRTSGRSGRDVGTRELTLSLADALEDRTGQRPIVVINNLHRRKLDANREIVEAAEGDPRAEAAWEAYHSAILQARIEVERRHGAGLFLDLHGHDHPMDWLELGYLLDNDDLEHSDAELDGPAFEDGTSLGELVRRSGEPLSAIVRGEISFGALMESRGYASVPSPEIPSPGQAAFYDGGYSTERYGSLDGGTVSAFQLEYAGPMRTPAAVRDQTADDTADALVVWMRALYGEAWLPG